MRPNARHRLACLVLLPALAAPAAWAQMGGGGGGSLVNPPPCPAGFVYRLPPVGPAIMVLDTGRTIAGNVPTSQADILHLRSCPDTNLLTLGNGECACRQGGDSCPSTALFSFPFMVASCPKPIDCASKGTSDNGLSLQGCRDNSLLGKLEVDLDIDFDIGAEVAGEIFLDLGAGGLSVPADSPWSLVAGTGRGCLDNGVVVEKLTQMMTYRVQLSFVPQGGSVAPGSVLHDGETENYTLKTWQNGGVYFAQLQNDDPMPFPPVQCMP